MPPEHTDSATVELARPMLIVVSGPSGVGKSTICQRLCAMLGAAWSVSVTTRSPRPGEVDGVHYRFIDRVTYDRLVAEDKLLEHAEVHGNGYGTPAEPVDEAIAAGKSVVMEIDVIGAAQVRRRRPDGLYFFVEPPTAEELARRIRDRKTDSDDVIRRRLERSVEELNIARDSGTYDYFVINDDLRTTENKILRLIQERVSAS